MEIVNNKALLLTLKNPGRVLTVIPKSKELPNNQVLVHWGLEEAQVLKNLGIKNVPSPILNNYTWPGIHTPFEHQRTTSSFLTLHKRAFIFSDPGTGKTNSVIWAADYLMSAGKINRCLIVCPLSIMDAAWKGDLGKTAMHRTCDIAYGSRDTRQKVINSDTEFVIINYDGLPIVEEDILNAGFDLVVVDECTAYQNANTTRWKLLNRIVRPNTWLWMMTGTPAAKSPDQAFGLAKLINPVKVPRFYGAFRDKVMYKTTQYKWANRPEAAQIVHEALQPAIRYTKDECLDLPDMTYVVRDVALTPPQKKYYDVIKKDLYAQMASEPVTAVNAAVGLNKLLQISSGCVYSDNGKTIEFDISNRYKVLTEIIDETPRKVLIFVPFTHTIDLLETKLLADKYTTEVIKGSVSAGKRADIFKRFQTQPDPRILLIQPQSAAHGVTLVEADTIVWWGPTASLEVYTQANARAHRAGQKFPVTVYRLQGSPAEKHLYKMLDKRNVDHNLIVDLYKDVLQ